VSEVRANDPDVRAAVRAAGLAIGVQLLHFAEELATGFPERFPPQLGLSPWSAGFFVAFNLFWLVVWVWSARALGGRARGGGRRLAVAALWFLAIAGIANALAHPALAIRAGGYFPGLVTSPLIGVAGLVLARRLAGVTR
jgi:hypothetical protein